MYTSPYTALRLAHFCNVLGPVSPDVVFHSPDNRIPHVDIYTAPPLSDDDVYAFFSDGVSDRRMAVPSDVPPEILRRIELVANADTLDPRVPSLLKRIVDSVFSDRTFLGAFHTYGFAQGTAFKFREFLFAPAGALDGLVIEGDPVQVLTVLPLTHREYVYATENGPEELFRIFKEALPSPSFDSIRQSIV